MDTDMVLVSSLGQDITTMTAPVGSAGHSNWHEPSSCKALKHQHDIRCQPRSRASAQPSMGTGTSDSNIDLSCGLAKDPGMAVAAALPIWCHGPSWQHMSLRSVWPQRQHSYGEQTSKQPSWPLCQLLPPGFCPC